ncbi:MAG: DNA alkylation repair protein [Muribaculaceae bacterium]|nr:DNA alkylation repair protein [Muribaculaceae bacterium]
MILSEENVTFGRMQNVKRRFFALRNGITADIYRRAGAPYKVIFGLDMVQLAEVGKATGIDVDLAEALWANDTTRESRLLAPMVMDVDRMGIERAIDWIKGVKSCEEADVMCHKLLRRLPYVTKLVDVFKDSPKDMERYVSIRLIANLVSLGRIDMDYMAALKAEKKRSCVITERLCSQVIDEINFIEGV